MRRHRSDMNVMSEMNLTNMLDTAFVLVLALMMVAPMIKHGIQLQLPVVGDPGALSTEPKTLTIAIAPSQGPGLPDFVYIEDGRVTIDDMENIVNDRRKLYPKLDVLIEADAGSRYETFAQVVAGLKRIGVENISLPTDITPPGSKSERKPAAPVVKH